MDTGDQREHFQHLGLLETQFQPQTTHLFQKAPSDPS